jgi:uncharacterized LabA/DUF88 family protein
MLFVDGENFTKAAQRVMTTAGIRPERGAFWRRDVFMWPPEKRPRWTHVIEPTRSTGSKLWEWTFGADLRRAYYYTADTADEPEWTATQLAIRDIGFEPRLFKRRQGKSKAVDIALATDVLTLGAAGHYEAVAVVAGDGDYVPIVEAVKRFGLHCAVAFFSIDTSDALRIAADEYIDLTGPLLDAWTNFFAERERRREQQVTKAATEAARAAMTADGDEES